MRPKKDITPEELIAALESGRYRQGNGCFKSDESYCCLGVAAELMLDAKLTDEQGRLGIFGCQGPTLDEESYEPARVFLPETHWLFRIQESLWKANDEQVNLRSDDPAFAWPIRKLRHLMAEGLI